MAAVSSAKSTGTVLEKRERQKGRTKTADAESVIKTKKRLLTQDEARCPVCYEIFLEPVTMPCSHSVCLPCFKQTVEFSTLCCPLCRLRVSSWTRRQSRENTLVNTELWNMVRQSYPERCKRRMEQREGEAVGEDIIFRAPVPMCKSGEIRQKYENKKKKILEDDRRQVECEKRKVTLLRPEDPGPLHGVLSDSENEEPIGKRTRHVSAFVRKIRSSPALNQTIRNHVVQRSRSCTDTEDERGKSRCPSQLPAAARACIVYSHNAGILLSSENSRSLSAPILVPDKKHVWRGVAAAPSFMAPPAKPERSISPESNDSISEELNHFKPIVCSPCTPPKRLPDGRVVEPTIVKSTPRNLSRNLPKPTSYEASPTILQKWKQIEIDRQYTKVTSKGTITSPFSEDFTLKKGPVEKSKFPKKNVDSNVLKDHWAVSLPKTGTSGQDKVKTSRSNKRRLIFDQPIGDPSLGIEQLGRGCSTTTALSILGGDIAGPQDTEACSLTCGGMDMPVCVQTSVGSQEQRVVSDPRQSVNNRPTSRRGKKRSQKTKHLEEVGTPKKSKPKDDDCFVTENDCSTVRQWLQQEKDDHALAMKLQRKFNKEFEKLDRRKTNPDRYLLRSWASNDSRSECIARRSGRTCEKH